MYCDAGKERNRVGWKKTGCKFSELNKYLPNTAVLSRVNHLTKQITAWHVTLNTSQSFNWSTHSLLMYNYKVLHNCFKKHNYYSKVTDRTTEESRFPCQQGVYTRHMPSQCSQGQLCWSTVHVNIVTWGRQLFRLFFAAELAISGMVCPTESH